VAPERAAAYLQKAEEFFAGAKRALDEGAPDSAALLAIHAAITACDSLTVRHLGLRSTSPRHLDVLTLVDRLPTPQKDQLKKHLRDLVSKKNVVEYEDRLLPRGDAVQMVKIAGRVVAAARAGVGR
jgi:HEPN domain-containing protein